MLKIVKLSVQSPESAADHISARFAEVSRLSVQSYPASHHRSGLLVRVVPVMLIGNQASGFFTVGTIAIPFSSFSDPAQFPARLRGRRHCGYALAFRSAGRLWRKAHRSCHETGRNHKEFCFHTSPPNSSFQKSITNLLTSCSHYTSYLRICQIFLRNFFRRGSPYGKKIPLFPCKKARTGNFSPLGSGFRFFR